MDGICSSLGVIGTPTICNTGPVAWADNYYAFCTVSNPVLDGLTKNIGLNASIQKNAITGDFYASIFAANLLQFSCVSTNCKQDFTPDLNTSTWTCPNTKCICNPGSYACGGGAPIDLTSYINGATGGYVLKSNRTYTNLYADFLSAIFAEGIDLVDCRAGECVRADASPAPPPAISVIIQDSLDDSAKNNLTSIGNNQPNWNRCDNCSLYPFSRKFWTVGLCVFGEGKAKKDACTTRSQWLLPHL